MARTKEEISAYKKEFYSVPENRERKREYDRQWRLANEEKVKASQRKYYEKNPDKMKEKVLRRTEDLRNETFSAYGDKCACCGETERMFLTIDHVFNDGAEERRKLFGTRVGQGVAGMYRWLKKNGFPQDRYQLMCYNCNCGRHRNGGICPHQSRNANTNEADERS